MPRLAQRRALFYARGMHRSFAHLFVATAFLLVTTSLAIADGPSPRYERTAPTADGIGKRYMGRDIARIMGWQGAEWLERAEREQEERTDLMLPELKLQPGMHVADVGAGTGYIARRMAKLVGSRGNVYAVDVQPEMVRMLTAMTKRENLPNIKPVLGAIADVNLVPDSIDVAIMVDVYHELEQPYELVASIVRALKVGGRLVFVEYKSEDPSIPIKPLHKMSVEQVKREAAAHALEFERVDGKLPWQHIIVFRKVVQSASK